MVPNSGILAIDIGNTAMKVSLFHDETLVEMIAGSDVTLRNVELLLGRHHVDGAICCRVGKDESGIVEHIGRIAGLDVMEITPETAVPVTTVYDRKALGADRLVGVVGVARENENVLLVDAGTAVTLDMVRGLRHEGGNISPGIDLRFDSLHRFTQRLPLVEADGPAPLLGHDTLQAIRTGVLRGIAYEVAGTWQNIKTFENNTKIVLTGGNASQLSKQLTILCIPHVIDREAVGRGLVRIFNYNNNDSNE